jgi:hypothetical protein
MGSEHSIISVTGWTKMYKLGLIMKNYHLNSNSEADYKMAGLQSSNISRISWTLVVHTIILTTQEAKIRRISVRTQPRQIVHEILS